MLSFEPNCLGRLASALAFSSFMALSGCQVRPLYATGPAAAGAFAPSQSISVNEVTSRYAQEVRNHLIFLMNGGAREPAGAAYKLELGVTKRVTTVAGSPRRPAKAGDGGRRGAGVELYDFGRRDGLAGGQRVRARPPPRLTARASSSHSCAPSATPRTGLRANWRKR